MLTCALSIIEFVQETERGVTFYCNKTRESVFWNLRSTKYCSTKNQMQAKQQQARVHQQNGTQRQTSQKCLSSDRSRSSKWLQHQEEGEACKVPGPERGTRKGVYSVNQSGPRGERVVPTDPRNDTG